MATRHVAADEPFFREWQAREVGERRSLQRAARLKTVLGLDNISIPTLVAVGSKGKGTIATYASATLAASGLKVGTLTSPSMLSNRERIRVAGVAISPEEYSRLAAQLSASFPLLQSRADDGGYLSPTGLFTLMGVRHFVDNKCDVIVLEAGMGGRSDEVSLFSPIILAVGPIFEEHIGLLGANPAEIAQEKIGAANNETHWVISAPQRYDVSAVLEKAIAQRLIYSTAGGNHEDLLGKIQLPPGFSGTNAKVGIIAGLTLVEEINANLPRANDLQRVLQSIRYPGRLSVHSVRGAKWVLDAAVDEQGVAKALEWCSKNVGTPDKIFVSFPDSKDVAGAQRALIDFDYVPVAVNAPHLKYSAEIWPAALVPVEAVTDLAKGACVLFIGTLSFIAAILETIGVDLEHLYEPLRHVSTTK